MKPEEVLHVRRLPGKLAVEQVAVLLGFQPHDIPMLVSEGLLEPTGNPPAASCVKFFATEDILVKTSDRKWIHRATACVYRHWQSANERRRKNQPKKPQTQTP